MGQYKVPQNVEAEDRILGPLTFRQFIYAIIGVGWGMICFAIFRPIPALMIIVGAPPTILFLLLAFYNRDGQNFEQLLLAMIGYFAAPRRRLWVKENVIETFHVEPTKKAAELTQRDPVQVHSELERLAILVDSRGWDQPPQPDTHLVLPSTPNSDRIVAPAPAAVAPEDLHTDILDLQKSPLAQNLAQLLQQAADDVKAEALQAARAQVAGAASPSISGVTPAAPGDILKLATQSDDVSVSMLAAQANRTVETQRAS